MILITHPAVAQWVNARMPFPLEFGPHQAIGFHRDGDIVCGAVFNNYHRMPYGDSVDVTFATNGPGSLTKGALRAMFSYAFDGRVVRLQAMTAKTNEPARKLLHDLGFTLEMVIKRGFDGRTAAALYRMFPEDCRWLGKSARESLAA